VVKDELSVCRVQASLAGQTLFPPVLVGVAGSAALPATPTNTRKKGLARETRFKQLAQ